MSEVNGKNALTRRGNRRCNAGPSRFTSVFVFTVFFSKILAPHPYSVKPNPDYLISQLCCRPFVELHLLIRTPPSSRCSTSSILLLYSPPCSHSLSTSALPPTHCKRSIMPPTCMLAMSGSRTPAPSSASSLPAVSTGKVKPRIFVTLEGSAVSTCILIPMTFSRTLLILPSRSPPRRPNFQRLLRRSYRRPDLFPLHRRELYWKQLDSNQLPRLRRPQRHWLPQESRQLALLQVVWVYGSC